MSSVPFTKLVASTREIAPPPPPPPAPPSRPTRRATTNYDPAILSCTAQGCKKAFQASTAQLVRKALMRHLFRYQKYGVEVDANARSSDLTAKQIFNRAHYVAYKTEVLANRTSEEKQAASRAKYKKANKEKVARASRIANYRAQAKQLPEIMGQGIEAVHKWAEEREKQRPA